MFSLHVLSDNGIYQYTLVKPDTTVRSGSRDDLTDILDIVHDEIKGWDVQQKQKEGSIDVVMDDC